jgi:NADH-quinone oxidoreductase subunit C
VTAETANAEPAAVAAIRARLAGAVRDVTQNAGQWRVTVDRSAVVALLTWLRDDPAMGFDFLVDLTAIDHWPAEPRFSMVYVLRCMPRREELVVKCDVTEEDCRVPTIDGVYRCANSLEREVFDMFGIQFDGHPDLRRILMHESFTDFPMRKDFPMQGKMTDQEWAEWIVARAQRTEDDHA